MLGNFVSGDSAKGLEKASALLSSRHFSEDEFNIERCASPHNNFLLYFSGDRNHFNDLAGHELVLLQELRNITRPALLRSVDRIVVPPIVLNIRRGRDFAIATNESEYFNRGAILTPLSWFRTSLQEVRGQAGSDVPALIISDGDDDDLREILELEAVQRAKTKTAIEDLLLMSRAKLILGSGGSSFTAWGAFLGQSHIITVAGQSLSWFGLDNASIGRVATWGARENRVDLDSNILQCLSDD